MLLLVFLINLEKLHLTSRTGSSIKNKLQAVVVEYLVKKFKEKSQHQPNQNSKLDFLRQQYRYIEEIRDVLSKIKISKIITNEIKKQRKEQIKGRLLISPPTDDRRPCTVFFPACTAPLRMLY